MARTAIEIEQSIDDEATNFNQLDALQDNSSFVSFWNYAKKVVVFVAFTLEKFLDQHKVDVNNIIERTETGSIDWYLAVALEYQHGDNLIVENNRPVYSIIDENKRIIKRVAIKEDANAKMFFKVVKEENDEFEKLNQIELSAFTAYINRRKITGTRIDVQSLDADLLDLAVSVTLSPILFDDMGKLLSDNSIEPILEAIEAHLKVFDFGGIFYLSRLIDKVMNVEGVKDFFITASQLNGTAFSGSIESNAGHIKLGNNTQLNYVLS